MRQLLSTRINRILAWLAGVKLGRGSLFYGRTTFFRSSGAGIRIGHSCTFKSAARANFIGVNRPCMFTAHGTGQIRVGDRCGFSGTVIGAFSLVELGDRVRCGANTLITDGDWHGSDSRSGDPRPVKIGNDVWLGVNVTVLKGVTIGDGTVIGAGSVVTKDIPANCVAAGNPCRVIAQRGGASEQSGAASGAQSGVELGANSTSDGGKTDASTP